MTDKRPLTPWWYVGDGVTEPTRTFHREGEETDTDHRVVYDSSHHFEWADARDAMLADARAGLSLGTRSLLRVEKELNRMRIEVADSAKEIFAIEKLKEPTT